MMTSDVPNSAYVWIWLPGATRPVVAGFIERVGDLFIFNYGQSYLKRNDAIPIYLPELPLERGAIPPDPPLVMASALRDGAPDSWGRRVIINLLTGKKGEAARNTELDELTYLLHSGSDRIGALDFQASADVYIPRDAEQASLVDLQDAARRVENGKPLNKNIDQALYHGSSIGGARPKVLIDGNGRKYIAKFSATGDTYSVIKAEFIAMRLAALAGLEVASVKLEPAGHKTVLLIERFDRVKTRQVWTRRAMVSALTLFGLHEEQARYASYEDLAEIIRSRFENPEDTLRELFSRIVFNILVGNIDDHARNHAAFWDGEHLSLTPAYDICPQSRTGRTASHAMKIHNDDNRSKLIVALSSAKAFLLTDDKALDIMRSHILCIRENWKSVCKEAKLSRVDKDLFWQRQFLNPYAFEGMIDILGGAVEGLKR